MKRLEYRRLLDSGCPYLCLAAVRFFIIITEAFCEMAFSLVLPLINCRVNLSIFLSIHRILNLTPPKNLI